MRRTAQAVLSALSILVTLPQLARAETKPAQAGGAVSYSLWTVDGATVRVRVILPVAAARTLAADNAPPPGPATVASAVSRGMAVTSPAGDCEAIDQGEGVGQIYTLALTPGLDQFEIVFSCPQATGLVLKNRVLFARDPAHIDFARIQIGRGRPALQAFTRDRQSIALPASAGQLHAADPLIFARLAAMALATSVAGFGILFGSLLACRRWLDLAWLCASLAAGYLASIALALPGVVALERGLAQSEEGILVATLGLGGIISAARAIDHPRWRWAARIMTGLAVAALAAAAAASRSPTAGLATGGTAVFALGAGQAARVAPRLRLIAFAPAAIFAFLDGLAPASDLGLLQPTPDQLTPILVGHDLGSLAAAAAITGVGMGLTWLAGRGRRAWRAPASEIAGAVLIGLGLFWFVTRLHS